MKKLILIMCCLLASGLNAIRLRNGAEASNESVKEVWHALQTINKRDFYWLWRVCVQNYNVDPYRDLIVSDLVKPIDGSRRIDEAMIRTLRELNIIKGNVINNKTQHIIVSSYNESRYNKMKEPISVKLRYPVNVGERIKWGMNRMFYDALTHVLFPRGIRINQ